MDDYPNSSNPKLDDGSEGPSLVIAAVVLVPLLAVLIAAVAAAC